MAILPKKSTGFDRCCSIDRFEIILTTASIRTGNYAALRCHPVIRSVKWTMMTKDYNPLEDIATLKALIYEFKSNLPNRVDPASLTWTSKIPWKAVNLRETLLYRITELAESAIDLYEKKNRMISAFIITRAVHETTALFYSFYTKLKQITGEQSLGDFDDFLMKLLFGFKNDKEFPTAINILNAVDKLNKQIDSFRYIYDRLSEFCHPNYSGVFGAYAKINKETGWVDFGTDVEKMSPMIGLHPLVASLNVFKYYYNESTELIPTLIEICESCSKQNTKEDTM